MLSVHRCAALSIWEGCYGILNKQFRSVIGYPGADWSFLVYCIVLTYGHRGPSAARLTWSLFALFSQSGCFSIPALATPIILLKKKVVLHGGQGSLGWHCRCSSPGFRFWALAVLSLIPRNFYKICFNKVSELSEQQVRDISISSNFVTVGLCMGTEVP